MKKILIIHPEGNIYNNPNLTGIVEILCENGYTIEIVSPRRPEILQKSPCDRSSLRLIQVSDADYASKYSFVVPSEFVYSLGHLQTYLHETFGDIDLIIGVDRGIIDASLIARTLNKPFGLISFEVYFVEETGKEFKVPEIEACRGISFAVCQDRIRSSHLALENSIPLEKIIDIPVAGRTVKRGEHLHTLHQLLNVDRRKKIALCIGHIDGRWTGMNEILESTLHWNEDWVLVLHHRYGTSSQQALLQKIKTLNTNNVYISPFPSLPFDQMHMLLHSSDLGIAFYLPQHQSNFLECRNLLYLGMASGKISTYLQYGLPVMVNEIGELSTHVGQQSLGIVVTDFKEIPSKLNSFTQERLSLCKENCYRFFENYLDLNRTIRPLMDIIASLCENPVPVQSHELQSNEDYDLSIVLATKNRAQSLDEMLASIKNAAGSLKYEVIVIEGNSSDNTLEVLHRHGAHQIYQEAEHLGEGKHSWPRLYNFGFSKARGRWGMYASDDIVFEKDCLANGVSTLDKQNSDVVGGIFFYKDVYPESPDWANYGICFTIGQHFLMNYGLVRMDFFRDVQGLDENFRFYQADADLSLKAVAKGKYFIPLPESFLIHRHKLESKKQADEEYGKKDTEFLIQKWRGLLALDLPFPFRLMYDEDCTVAFSLPRHLSRLSPEMKEFWHGISWFQKKHYQEATEKFIRAFSSCDHWIVLWYIAKSLIESGRIREGKQGIELVIQAAPDFREAKELLAQLGGLGAHSENVYSAPPQTSATHSVLSLRPQKKLVIQIKYGGLGDHLFYSHLPRIAKQTGAYDQVYISNYSEYRSADYKRIIWELNPYVDGFCDETGFYPEFGEVEEGINLLDKIMLLQGIDDGKRFHEPEIYYKPAVIPGLKDMTVYDPNFISYVGDLSAGAMESYFTRNGVTIDYQMKLRDKSLAVSRFNQFLETESFEHFCSIIVSCKQLYCLASGTATLASALAKPATVFFGKGQKTMFHHSSLHTYIMPDDDGGSYQTCTGPRQQQQDTSLFILHTVEFYPPHSGGGIAIQKISEGLAKRGHHVEVATAKSPDRTYRELHGVVIREFDVEGTLVSGIRGNDIQRYQEFLLNHPAGVMMNYAAQQWATDLAFIVLESTRDKRVNIIAPCGYPALQDVRTVRWPEFEKYFSQLIPLAVPLYHAAVYHSSKHIDYEFAHLHRFQNSVIIPDGVDDQELAKHPSIGEGKLTWDNVVDLYEELYLRLYHAKNKQRNRTAIISSFETKGIKKVIPPAPPFEKEERGDVRDQNEYLDKNEEVHLLEMLKKDFRDVPALVRLSQIALLDSNPKRARNYLIAAMALEPHNMQVKALWAKLNR